VVIAAHGSWEPGNLTSQHLPQAPQPGHLFGFKAHLKNTELPGELMPLLAFPGGYGGLVHSNGGLVSLSCCIRRDVLMRLTRGPSGTAGSAVLTHILETCSAARRVLHKAQLADKWLSSGPIRPGIREMYKDGIFRVGNAAGEAHPAVAEGIGMAMQSAWLLAECLPDRAGSITDDALQWVGREYTRRWRQTFVSRIRAAGLFASLAMRPRLSSVASAAFQCIPSMLALCAAWSGKTALPFSVREVGYQV
jgi:flavin-dependent dehydrogenase